jgi:hypothetical protein
MSSPTKTPENGWTLKPDGEEIGTLDRCTLDAEEIDRFDWFRLFTISLCLLVATGVTKLCCFAVLVLDMLARGEDINAPTPAPAPVPT